MIKRKLALSAGHSNKQGRDNGANYNNRIEGVEAAKFRSDLVKALEKRKIVANVDIDSNITFETVKLFKEYFGEHDILIDIHFNTSTSPTASGTEVIIPTKYSTMEYAIGIDICNTISTTLGIPNRGVKREDETPRGKLAFMSIDAETILIEMCFISNKSDMARYDTKYETLINKLADLLTNYKSIRTL